MANGQRAIFDESKGTIFTFLSGDNAWHSSTEG